MWTKGLLGLLLVLYVVPSLWAQSEFAGEWMVTTVDFGQASYERLVLTSRDGGLAGVLSGEPVEITANERDIAWKSQNSEGKGVLDGTEITGEMTRYGTRLNFTAERIPAGPVQSSTHDFEPTRFELYFSSAPEPVLRVYPGDTVRTWGVDAGGRDANGVRRSPGGNPQTGPFYIGGAMPGDTLVVKINKVRLNRDWAVSGSSVMLAALRPYHVSQLQWDRDFRSVSTTLRHPRGAFSEPRLVSGGS